MIKELTYPLEYNQNWEIVDASKLTEFMECPQKYFYRHVLGWRSTAPNNHLVFGHAWHKAQEHLLLNGYDSVDEAVMLFMADYRETFGPETDELFGNKTPTKADAALRDYAAFFKDDLRRWEVLYTEIAGSVMITEDHLMHFRMDSVLREKDTNKKFSLDHKTGSKKGRTWTDKWLLSTATGLYTHVLYCLYPREEVKGMQYRGTFFYKSKPVEFEEVPCWKSLNQMQSWLWNTVYWYNLLRSNFELLSEARDSEDVLMAFPMQTESCTKYFGCPYHDFCTAWTNPLQRCETPPMGFEVEFWNPADEETTTKMEGLA
uniref:Putative PD-(D/E)XK nuclease superfamily protein n=1 Tax=viral metagenome TaxID=1070528 RepID=A0A6M3KT28_9ZZZZ